MKSLAAHFGSLFAFVILTLNLFIFISEFIYSLIFYIVVGFFYR